MQCMHRCFVQTRFTVADVAAHLTLPAQARVPSLSPRDDAGGEGA
jgi:hypothetical protein